VFTNTFGWTILDEGSARHRDFYLTAHNTHNRHIIAPVGFEHAIPASERPQTDALEHGKSKGKAVQLQAWSGPERSRKLRFPDVMTTAQDGGKVVSLTHTAAFTPRKYTWYSFLLEAESTPGP
jgi:hypothetical protein